MGKKKNSDSDVKEYGELIVCYLGTTEPVAFTLSIKYILINSSITSVVDLFWFKS